MPAEIGSAVYRETLSIRQIAIMDHTYPMWEVGIQWLCLGTATRPGRWISDMSQTGRTPEFNHVMIAKDILDKSIVLTEVKSSMIGCYYTGSVLTTMLEDRKAVGQHLVDMSVLVGEKDTKDPAHHDVWGLVAVRCLRRALSKDSTRWSP
jgi:hypothetical protein